MEKQLQDFKVKDQETRLILFGSTVFKLKYRASRELRAAIQVQSRAEIIQNDLKVSSKSQCI